ncbi:MAG: hypothetical protein IAB19_05650 [Proteobacteria bacterium]|uniref:site-specific DNA-methyltransferase (adenine-specific) n=1 Tax=Candidatus Avisuccinivibrio stercorigallinarum TaxID=2840704 RepID=A0A9D9DCK2_9GAMM|nr:hypothetical protein [Candidatus Avisuccinivibrio stercorigallinarum]
MLKLRVPCTYQGGKQRISRQIARILLEAADRNTVFYDLCCGSGAVSIELVSEGVEPERITMLDLSSWGAFWQKVGRGTFDLAYFDKLLSTVPEDKHQVKTFMTALAARQFSLAHEAELYLLLQSCSFGGKQIWYDGRRWVNAFFRDYWEPTEHSVRRSPANPMQPGSAELRRRLCALIDGMNGVTCFKQDIGFVLSQEIPQNAVVYVDPPYQGTTGYAYGFDLHDFCSSFRAKSKAQLFVSEGRQISEYAVQLNLGGAKGGISGNRIGKHQEWLNVF